MIIKRKTQLFLALLVACIFLFQNCATIIRGTSQKIPVTSNPFGAKIIVDGEEVGYAPLLLKLKRKISHIIRIEKEGHDPLEIRIVPELLPKRVANWGNALLGGVPGSFLGIWLVAIITSYNTKTEAEAARDDMAIISGGCVGAVAGYLVAKRIDSASGSNYTLDPKELNVTLTKIEGQPQPNLSVIDAEELKNIKWIRIKFDDSDGDNKIANSDHNK